jgi:signal transduction histidine kinase
VAETPEVVPDFKLRIDSHALVQLGEQLITDDEQALLEIVKNSYDADAEWARIQIDTDYVPSAEDHAPPEAIGLIQIADNGAGMDQRGIELGWLLISVSLKRSQKISGERSRKFHRLPLGDKGLGRLGTMKLGKFLSVETRHSATEQGWLVTFQWSDAKSGIPLDEVPISKRRVPANGSTGTTVRIFGLHDVAVWRSDARHKRLESKLSGLLSPFQPIDHFDVTVEIDDRPIDLAKIGPRLRESAAVTFDYQWDGNSLQITGRLKLAWFHKRTPGYAEYIARDGGKTFFEELQSKKNFVKEFQPALCPDGSWFLCLSKTREPKDLPFVARNATDPGPFSGSFDHFELDENIVLPKNLFQNASDYRELVKALAQVYVYRDGFGIRMPNDWLRLGAAWTSQTGFYSLKPSNTIGFFQLSVADNPQLIEKSDREGFTDNEAWRGFALLATLIASSANKALNRLGKAAVEFLNQKTGLHATDEQSSANYGELITRLERLLSTSEAVQSELRQHTEVRRRALGKLEGATRLFVLDLGQAKDKRDKAKQLLESVEKLESGLAEDYSKIDKLTTELLSERELAAIIRRRIDEFDERTSSLYEMVGVGLSAKALAHDAPPMLEHLERQAKAFKKLANTRDFDAARISESADSLATAIAAVRQMLDFVQPMLRGRRLSKRRTKVSAFARDFYELRGARLYARGIKWHLESEEMRDFEISFNPGRFNQVLDNLTTNSEYWIEQLHGVNSGRGRITVEIRDPEFIFYDNGPGVQPDLEESIFDLFATGKDDTEGNGLGLFITRQLLARDNCGISLMPDRNEHDRRYRFAINFAGVKAR